MLKKAFSFLIIISTTCPYPIPFRSPPHLPTHPTPNYTSIKYIKMPATYTGRGGPRKIDGKITEKVR
jgi:hypothetical protein